MCRLRSSGQVRSYVLPVIVTPLGRIGIPCGLHYAPAGLTLFVLGMVRGAQQMGDFMRDQAAAAAMYLAPQFTTVTAQRAYAGVTTPTPTPTPDPITVVENFDTAPGWDES